MVDYSNNIYNYIQTKLEHISDTIEQEIQNDFDMNLLTFSSKIYHRMDFDEESHESGIVIEIGETLTAEISVDDEGNIRYYNRFLFGGYPSYVKTAMGLNDVVRLIKKELIYNHPGAWTGSTQDFNTMQNEIREMQQQGGGLGKVLLVFGGFISLFKSLLQKKK